MKATLALLTLSMLLAGCAPDTRIRKEAALTLDCEGAIKVSEEPAYQSWIAEGCGRQVFCTLNARDHRSEVFCAGGAPARALR